MFDCQVLNADNDVENGIQLTDTWLSNEIVVISPNCHWTTGELNNYIWDIKMQEKGEDKPVKINDHACDALRYHNYTVAIEDAMATPQIEYV